MTEHHREEVVHDVEELRRDLAFERATLDESVKHDYSTADTGIVPLDRRRPIWHFAGLADGGKLGGTPHGGGLPSESPSSP